jgi:flavodoxin
MKNMKKSIFNAMVLMTVVNLSACNKAEIPEDTPEETPVDTAHTTAGNVLIAYFSCTGNTEKVAGYIAEETDGTLYKIVPETPYTSANLDYNNSNSRANQEQNNPSARPVISDGVEDMAQYDVVFLGYPIWWAKAPKIIFTFLESYDFSGKTIIPFCTSGSSGIGSSDADLHSLAAQAMWKQGRRFGGNEAKENIVNWIESLDLKPAQSNVSTFERSKGENDKHKL